MFRSVLLLLLMIAVIWRDVDNRQISIFHNNAFETLHCFFVIPGDAHVDVTLFTLVTQCDSNIFSAQGRNLW